MRKSNLFPLIISFLLHLDSYSQQKRTIIKFLNSENSEKYCVKIIDIMNNFGKLDSLCFDKDIIVELPNKESLLEIIVYAPKNSKPYKWSTILINKGDSINIKLNFIEQNLNDFVSKNLHVEGSSYNSAYYNYMKKMFEYNEYLQPVWMGKQKIIEQKDVEIKSFFMNILLNQDSSLLKVIGIWGFLKLINLREFVDWGTANSWITIIEDNDNPLLSEAINQFRIEKNKKK